MKKFLRILISIFFWGLTRFAVFSAIASASYSGTWAGMFLHGLFWPYKLVYWFVKNFALDTGFTKVIGDLFSAAISGIVGMPVNFATDPIPTLVIGGFFLLIHFVGQKPLRKLKEHILFKLKK